MGTRGIYGFYKEPYGDKLTYNHYDSYPSYLGIAVLKFLRETSIPELNKIADKIRLVNQNKKPTKKQISEVGNKYSGDKDVSNPDWYCLLRESQGDLSVYKDGLKYMIDNSEFIKDSLFCEWGYIINLDTNTLEVYRGFQTEVQPNRYIPSFKEVEETVKRYSYTDKVYYNCTLLAEYPLDNLPSDEDFIALEKSIYDTDEEAVSV